jgi:hypothetical protein
MSKAEFVTRGWKIVINHSDIQSDNSILELVVLSKHFIV